MQNGADIVKDQGEAIQNPPSSIQVAEAEISVESIKLGKHTPTGTGSGSSAHSADSVEQVDGVSQVVALLQKGTKNESATSPDTSVPEKTDQIQCVQETGDKNIEDKGETTVEEVKDSSAVEEELQVSEDEAAEESLVDNIGSDDTVMVEPYMQSLVKANGNDVVPTKKKRGRPPKKVIPEQKVKRKIGRPRKTSIEQAPKPSDTEAGEVSNSAPDPNMAVDLFTYVPGRTSEPIQLSTVSSVVSGSEGGSAASLDGEAPMKDVTYGDNSENDGHAEVKKLLKSKLLKNTSPNSDRSRKRKATSEKESLGKKIKVTSRPPAEDSSSLQKKQDMIDFLHATEKALSGQDMDRQMEVQGEVDEHQSDDAIATALMSQGPCLDLDEDEPLSLQTSHPLSFSVGKKMKRKYVRKTPKKNSPKNPDNLKSLAEIANVSRSFEALNTSDPSDKVDNSGLFPDIPPVKTQSLNAPVKVKSSRIGRPKTRKYKKKNSLAALKARLARQPKLDDTVLDIHNGEMITPCTGGDETKAVVTENCTQKEDSVMAGSENDPLITNPIQMKSVAHKELSKTGPHRPRYRKKKFHKWHKKKKHSPAVLLRLANQMKALQAAQELARIEGAYKEEHPDPVESVPLETLTAPPVIEQPVVQLSPSPGKIKKSYKKGYTKGRKVQNKDGGNVNVPGSVQGVPSSEGAVAFSPIKKFGKKGSKKGGPGRKSSPVVQISPLSDRKDNCGDGNTVGSQSESHHILDDPPVLTKIAKRETNQEFTNLSQSLPVGHLTPDLNSPHGDQHSDISNSSLKRSYLKPKQAEEFEKDTGAVSLKNILPGRREGKKKSFMATEHSGYSNVSRGGISRAYNKGYRRGLAFMKAGEYSHTDSKNAVNDYVNQFGTARQMLARSPSPMSELNPVHPERNYYEKSQNHNMQSKPRGSQDVGDHLHSPDVFSSDDMNQTPSSHRHRPRERQESRGHHSFHRQSSSGRKHSYSEDNDPPSSSERNSNRSFTDSPKGKGVIGNTVGAVISQLFGDEIPRLTPGSGYVINVRLDVERKEATGTRKSHKSVSTQEDLDGGERRRHSSHHSTSREKSTHVSSTVNSYTRKSQSSEPQPSTSSTPDDPYPRETVVSRPRISDVDLCAMLEERISSRHGLRVDVRDNLLDNIKHVERVLKESS